MADCYYYSREQQLEDAVVHRLLPQEILVEIGIAADQAAADGQRGSHAVVEELAARLVGILGLTSAAGVGERRGSGAVSTPTTTTSATPPYILPHAQYRSHAREQHHLAGGGANGSSQGMVQYHRYHAAGFGMNQWLPPSRPTTSFAGTGVFLPRAEVYLTRSASNPPGINDKHLIRVPPSP